MLLYKLALTQIKGSGLTCAKSDKALVGGVATLQINSATAQLDDQQQQQKARQEALAALRVSVQEEVQHQRQQLRDEAVVAMQNEIAESVQVNCRASVVITRGFIARLYFFCTIKVHATPLSYKLYWMCVTFTAHDRYCQLPLQACHSMARQQRTQSCCISCV